MNITITPQPKANLLGGPENMKTELKTSLFIAAGETMPGVKQYYQIAKTIAGFINAEGGTLWLGVKDDGTAVGVESDLAILGGGSARLCKGPMSNDEGMTFGGTADQYILKLKELVKAFLGTSAEKYIAGASAAPVNGKIVVKVPVSPAEAGYVAYVYKWHPSEKKYSEEVYQRVANGTSHLEGFARDDFIRARFAAEMMKKMRQVKADAPKISAEELLQGFQALIAPQLLQGVNVVVTGGQPLTEEAIKPMGSPKGLIFDGEHVRDAKTWKDCYLALLEKLQSLDAAKFDALPDDAFFKKFFIRQVPRTRCTGCYGAKFGSAPDVRAKEVANKVYFYNPNYVVKKLLVHFGISAERVMIRAS